MNAAAARGAARLPPEVNRILYVRNLPYKTEEALSTEEIYDIFGKYGAIRQIRIGNRPDTRGTAVVGYEDIYDAKNAVDHLSGFNVCGRYLIVLYFQAARMQKRTESLEQKRAELEALRKRANT